MFNATTLNKTIVFDTPVTQSSHLFVLTDNSVRPIPVNKHVLQQIVRNSWSDQETLRLMLIKLLEETQNTIFNCMMSMGPGEWTLDHL